jgi:hypothetical protein
MPYNTSLTPVLVGGGLTFIGGLISGLIAPLVLGWRKDKSEEKNKRRKKYEQFVTTLYEHDHWIRTLYRIRLEQSRENELPPPYAKMEAMLHVYFPDLEPIIEPLPKAIGHYLSVIHVKAIKLRDTKELSPEDHAEIYKYQKEYFTSFTECRDLLREWAKREFPIKNDKITTKDKTI